MESPSRLDCQCTLKSHIGELTVDRFPPQQILITQLRVCSRLFARWNSRRRAAGVCAGGAWQERSSPGGSEDCRADRSTPGLKRPERMGEKNTWVKRGVFCAFGDVILKTKRGRLHRSLVPGGNPSRFS